jgi:hypothetical protein
MARESAPDRRLMSKTKNDFIGKSIIRQRLSGGASHLVDKNRIWLHPTLGKIFQN